MKQSAPQAAVTRYTPVTAGAWLQRQCACGAKTGALSGECDECRHRALGVQTRLMLSTPGDVWEQEADRVAARVTGMSDAAVTQRAPRQLQRLGGGALSGVQAPPLVTQTLRQPGQTLDTGTRAFFEPRLGYDLSRVRIHHDPLAATSARAVNAHAYTVGEHVVFGAGRFEPASSPGRSLLAHELAHVIQQRGALQRHAISPEPEVSLSPEDDTGHRPGPEPMPDETTEDDGGIAGGAIGVRLQRQIGDDIESSSWPEKDEADCIRAAGPDPAECTPSRTLTWADFSGTPNARSRFGAVTASDLRERDMNVALLQCSAPAVTAGLPSRGIQAYLDSTRSWVKARPANASDPAQNGCNTRVRACEAHFDAIAARGQTGGTYALSTAADRGCPAAARARGDVARSRSDCATLVATDCTDREIAESARLLQHEQGHFDLTCKMATKANGLLASAPSLATLLTNARATLRTQQTQYDRDSAHGCNASGQASWETDIAAGLPNVAIPLTAPPARRRGRRGRRR